MALDGKDASELQFGLTAYNIHGSIRDSRSMIDCGARAHSHSGHTSRFTIDCGVRVHSHSGRTSRSNEFVQAEYELHRSLYRACWST